MTPASIRVNWRLKCAVALAEEYANESGRQDIVVSTVSKQDNLAIAVEISGREYAYRRLRNRIALRSLKRSVAVVEQHREAGRRGARNEIGFAVIIEISGEDMITGNGVTLRRIKRAIALSKHYVDAWWR